MVKHEEWKMTSKDWSELQTLFHVFFSSSFNWLCFVFCGDIQMLIYIMAFPSLSTVWRFILFNEIIDRNLINIWISIIARDQSSNGWIHLHKKEELKLSDTLYMNVEYIYIKFNVSSWHTIRFVFYTLSAINFYHINKPNANKFNRRWKVTHSKKKIIKKNTENKNKMKSFWKMCLTFLSSFRQMFFDKKNVYTRIQWWI